MQRRAVGSAAPALIRRGRVPDRSDQPLARSHLTPWRQKRTGKHKSSSAASRLSTCLPPQRCPALHTSLLLPLTLCAAVSCSLLLPSMLHAGAADARSCCAQQVKATPAHAADGSCAYPGNFQAGAPAERTVYTCTEENWRRPPCSPDELCGRAGVILALGKFDAMHRGHRSLAEAAAALGGYPCLLSFWGMAEVLGLPARKPLTAEADRPRVLASWAPNCGGLTPMQRSIPFAAIRHLQPAEFIRVLAEDMQIMGIITGENYRFGYKAAGDAKLLQQLGREFSLKVQIMTLQGPHEPGLVGPTSSTKVRECLKIGRVKRIITYLDRPYALLVPRACLRHGQARSAEQQATGSSGRQASGDALHAGSRGAAGAHRDGAGGGVGSSGEDGDGSGVERDRGAAEARAVCKAPLAFDVEACLNQAPGDGAYHVMLYDGADSWGTRAVLRISGGAGVLDELDSDLCLTGPHLRIDLLDAL